MNCPTCNHKVCKAIHAANPNVKGVGMLLLHKYWVRQTGETHIVTDAIIERSGNNKDLANVVGGSMEPGECPLKSAVREYIEEYSPFGSLRILAGERGDELLYWNVFPYFFAPLDRRIYKK